MMKSGECEYRADTRRAAEYDGGLARNVYNPVPHSADIRDFTNAGILAGYRFPVEPRLVDRFEVPVVRVNLFLLGNKDI